MLDARQRRFVDEYLVDLNARAAATRAGYSAKTARVIGPRILKYPEVAAAIEAGQRARSERVQITADFVLTGLKENLERAMEAKPVLDAEGKATGTFKWDGGVANKALELLGKHIGMFKDVVLNETPVPVMVVRREGAKSE